MADEQDDKKMLDQALSAGDDWLRKQGVITDFSINTILAWIYLNFAKVQNVEMEVDKPRQRLYVSVYLGFWTLLWMTLLRRKDDFLDLIFNWLAEYLPTYEISVELKRWKGGTRQMVSPEKEEEKPEEAPEAEGNIAEALKAKREAKPKTE